VFLLVHYETSPYVAALPSRVKDHGLLSCYTARRTAFAVGLRGLVLEDSGQWKFANPREELKSRNQNMICSSKEPFSGEGTVRAFSEWLDARIGEMSPHIDVALRESPRGE
jgi:hypothetical protein